MLECQHILTPLVYEMNYKKNQLISQIRKNKHIISSFSFDKNNTLIKCFLDWPYVRIKYISSFDEKIYYKKFNNLIDSIEYVVNEYYPFNSFSLEVFDIIKEEFLYNKIIRTKVCPFVIEGWHTIKDPIPNKHFASTQFKFVKNKPFSLSLIAFNTLQI